MCVVACGECFVLSSLNLCPWSRLVAHPAALDTVFGALCSAGHYDAALSEAVAALLGQARVTAGGSLAGGGGGASQPSTSSSHAEAGSWGGLFQEEEEGAAPLVDPSAPAATAAPSKPPLLVLSPSQAASMLSALAGLSHVHSGACRTVVSGLRAAIEMSPEQVLDTLAFSCTRYYFLPAIRCPAVPRPPSL